VNYGILSVTALGNGMKCRTSRSQQETRFPLVLNPSNHEFLRNTSKPIVSTTQLITQHLQDKHLSINRTGKHPFILRIITSYTYYARKIYFLNINVRMLL